MSERSVFASEAARALPPFKPPSLPSATIAAFFFRSVIDLPVAIWLPRVYKRNSKGRTKKGSIKGKILFVADIFQTEKCAIINKDFN